MAVRALKRQPKASGAVMNRNALYLVIGVLLVVIVGFAIYTYQQETRPGVELRVDEQGISIDGNG
jgi:hypothetical protein